MSTASSLQPDHVEYVLMQDMSTSRAASSSTEEPKNSMKTLLLLSLLEYRNVLQMEAFLHLRTLRKTPAAYHLGS